MNYDGSNLWKWKRVIAIENIKREYNYYSQYMISKKINVTIKMSDLKNWNKVELVS